MIKYIRDILLMLHSNWILYSVYTIKRGNFEQAPATSSIWEWKYFIAFRDSELVQYIWISKVH